MTEVERIRELGLESYKDTLYPNQLIAFEKAMEAKKPLIISGLGGGGKSYVILGLKAFAAESTAFTSTTGASAVDIEGVTCYSLLSLPREIPTKDNMKKVWSAYKALFKKNHPIKRIVTDEFSMLGPHTIDAYFQRITRISKTSKHKKTVPILFGDPTQLGNVVKSRSQEAMLIESKYGTTKLMASDIFKNYGFEVVVLDQNKRAGEDKEFQDNLQRIRFGQELDIAVPYFNQRVTPKSDMPKDAIYVATTNKQVAKVNAIIYARNTNPEWLYHSKTKGRFNKNNTNLPEILRLKEGLKVMILKNDPEPEKCFVNGDTGTVIMTLPEAVIVKLDRNDEEVMVEYAKDTEIEYYTDDNDELKTREVGSFEQIGLVGSSGLTANKTQGKTLYKVIVDFESGCFAEGQAYVMLSRTRSLEDLYLVRPLRKSDIKVCPHAVEFYKDYI